MTLPGEPCDVPIFFADRPPRKHPSTSRSVRRLTGRMHQEIVDLLFASVPNILPVDPVGQGALLRYPSSGLAGGRDVVELPWAKRRCAPKGSPSPAGLRFSKS